MKLLSPTWGRLAEIVGEYLRKGSRVLIEGKLQTSSWEKNGQKQYKTEVVVREMKMLSSREGNGQRQSRPAPSPVRDDDFDEDVPF